MHGLKDGHRSVQKKNCCLNPEIGKHLEEFNAVPLEKLDEPGLVNPKRFREIINHIFFCQFCRSKLSETAKIRFTSEMFWGGYFLEGEARERRRKLRVLLHRYLSTHNYRGLDMILETTRDAEAREEFKRIERFLKD
jgi:hypothetical protein